MELFQYKPEALKSPQVEAKLVDIRNAYGLLLWHFKDEHWKELSVKFKQEVLYMLYDDYSTVTLNAVY